MAVTPTWTRHSVSNALLWANNITYGRLKVIQFGLTQQTTVPIYVDDIQLEVHWPHSLFLPHTSVTGPNNHSTVPDHRRPCGSPAVRAHWTCSARTHTHRLGSPGYTGLDPYTGQPTPLTGQLPVEPVSGYVQIFGDVSLTPGDTLTITVNPSGGGGYLLSTA